MLKAGASAYLLKACGLEELVHAIRTVAGGRTCLSPEIAGTVVEGYVNPDPADPSESMALSEREREVLQLLAEGKTAKQIGLHVRSRTIDSHRLRIMEKLNVCSLPELTKYAILAGLTSLEA